MRVDTTRIAETAQVGAALAAHDAMPWRAHARVDKWDPDQVRWVTRKTGVADPGGDFLAAHTRPYEVVEHAGNLATTAGLNRVTSLIIAAGGQAPTNTSARLGVGDATTAAAVGDTDLGAVAGSTHRWFQAMDASYPTQANGVITFRSTFASGDGNFTAGWQEWGIDIGTPTVTSGNTVNAVLLNHKIAAFGTKVSGAVWTFTTTLTLA